MMRRYHSSVPILALAYFIAAPAFAGPPSELMRALPRLSADEASCSVEALSRAAEQQAQEDMLRAQQLAMRPPTAASITASQGALIAQLMDPGVTMCDMNAAQQFASVDVGNELRVRLQEIQSASAAQVESDCPVTGMADYRDPACVRPIMERGFAREQEALDAFTGIANAQLQKEVDAYSACAAKREKLAADAETAQLPVQYLSMAQSAASGGWQQYLGLLQRREALCQVRQDAQDDLAMRRRDWQE